MAVWGIFLMPKMRIKHWQLRFTKDKKACFEVNTLQLSSGGYAPKNYPSGALTTFVAALNFPHFLHAKKKNNWYGQ